MILLVILTVGPFGHPVIACQRSGATGSMFSQQDHWIVSTGTNVEDRDNGGLSPPSLYLTDFMLFPTSAAGVVRLFARYGSDPSFQTRDKGLTLAHLHANKSCAIKLQVLQTLEEFGVGLKATDCEGRTLLHHCAIAGSLTKQALQFLCEKAGLDKDVQDEHGRTALQYATERRQKERDPNTFDSDRWSRTERILLGAPGSPQANRQVP